MTTTQPRERAVGCGWCWPRTGRTTWNNTAVCDDCTSLATLGPNPTNVVVTVWGPPLSADSEAGTALALARWHRDHTGGDAA
jgi:hypothetical protein